MAAPIDALDFPACRTIRRALKLIGTAEGTRWAAEQLPKVSHPSLAVAVRLLQAEQWPAAQLLLERVLAEVNHLERTVAARLPDQPLTDRA